MSSADKKCTHKTGLKINSYKSISQEVFVLVFVDLAHSEPVCGKGKIIIIIIMLEE